MNPTILGVIGSEFLSQVPTLSSLIFPFYICRVGRSIDGSAVASTCCVVEGVCYQFRLGF